MKLDIASLPKKRQRVIKYIIDNPDDVAISTSGDLAKKMSLEKKNKKVLSKNKVLTILY